MLGAPGTTVTDVFTLLPVGWFHPGMKLNIPPGGAGGAGAPAAPGGGFPPAVAAACIDAVEFQAELAAADAEPAAADAELAARDAEPKVELAAEYAPPTPAGRVIEFHTSVGDGNPGAGAPPAPVG